MTAPLELIAWTDAENRGDPHPKRTVVVAGSIVGEVTGLTDRAAAAICRAVEVHDDLVAACMAARKALRRVPRTEGNAAALWRLESALAAARGEPFAVHAPEAEDRA